MAGLMLGLLIPLAQPSGGSVMDVLVILLIGGLLALTVGWDKARQRRLSESAALYQDEDDGHLLIEPKYEEGGIAMAHLYAEGMNGQIEVDDEYVRISRRGVLAHTTRGIRGTIGRGIQIRLSDIEDIEISYPRLTQRGWIRFLTGGEDRIGIREAVFDQSTVLFTKRHQEEIDGLRQHLKELLARRSNEGLAEAIAGSLAAAPQVDFATQLRELAALRDEGLLTEEEFQAKKMELLSDR